jgi:hypothetical protein
MDIAQRAATETARGTRLALDILTGIDVSDRCFRKLFCIVSAHSFPIQISSARTRANGADQHRTSDNECSVQHAGSFKLRIAIFNCFIRVFVTFVPVLQLIDNATDDAIISDLVSSAASSCDDRPKGRINYNFGANKSRAEVHQFLRRNPHYLPHAEKQSGSPNHGQGAFDAGFISRFGAKNRSAEAYKHDIKGNKPRKL